MDGPVVTVVITNYNYARFVAAAINSALDQGPGVEVIVVDDGSTDGSIEILERYEDRIRLFTKPNGGQGSAFNCGFAATTGRLVMLLDADDRLLPGAVARLRAAAADAPGAAMFLHPLVVVDDAGWPTGVTLPEPGRTLPSGDLRSRVLSHPDDIGWQPSSGLAFRVDCLRKVLPVPAQPFALCADAYLVNTVPLHGPVVAIDRPGAEYRDHGGNAHLRSGFDLERARATLVRSDVTHDEIRRRAVALGLCPEHRCPRLKSVTDHATRLLVARLDRTGAGSVLRQTCFGIEAALRRPDVGWIRQVAMIGWFVTTAVAPPALLPTLAARALTR